MSARPEPVEAYRLCDLPPGTKFRYYAGGSGLVKGDSHRGTTPVYVVEWPQRTYDGIPADDLDALLWWVTASGGRPTTMGAAKHIRAAIAAQDIDQ